MKRIAALAVLLFAQLMIPPALAESAPTLTLDSLTMTPTAAGQQVEAAVTVTGPIDQWTLRLRVGRDPLPTRSSLGQVVEPAGYTTTVEGEGSIAKQERRTIIVRASVGRLELGAHPARIDLLNGPRSVRQVDFFLSQVAGVQTTPVVWLWPIIERPHRGVDGVFFDDQLAVSIANGGRLARLVTRGAGEPVVWVIDAALLASVEDMADGYRFFDGENTVERPANPAAAAWLDELAAATNDREVIVLPYGDPDLASLSQLRGNEISTFQQAGLTTAIRILDRAPALLRTDVAWPRQGRLSRTLLTDLHTHGYASVITSSREFANISGATFTPTARASEQEGVTPIVSDSVISTWMGRSDVVAASRVVAEIATITGERPATPRLQVIAPPRMWNPDPAALTYIQRELRSSLTSWSAALAAPAQTRAEISFTAAAFSPTFLESARSSWRAVTSVEAALGIELPDAHLLAAGAIASSLAEQTPPGLISRFGTGTRHLVNRIRVLPGRYTLTAKEQQIPVTVVNEFEQPVLISVSVNPHAPRIRAGATEPVEVPAQGRTQVLVPITSIATGLIAADAFVITRDGSRYGEGQVLTFDIRSIGPVANWVLWGSTALLALAVALRLTRRIRAARRAQ